MYLYTHIIGDFFLPRIFVPGVGDVDADGFAEEQTMQRILAVLQASDNANSPEAQQRLASAANTASRGILGLGKKTQTAGQQTQTAGSAAYQGLTRAGSAGSRFARDMNVAQRSIVQSFGRIDSAPLAVTQSLVKTGETVLQGAADFIPGFAGKALSVAISGLGVAAGFLLEKLNATTDAFFKVQATGATLGGSLIQFRATAHDANLTMSEFTNVMSKNSAAMSTFGGQTLQGAREFARANNRLANEFGPELLRMGYSFEEMGNATAEMMEKFALSGIAIEDVAIESRQFAMATRTNIQQQKIMSALMGRSIEQQKEAEKAQRRDAIVQASLQRLAPAQQKEMERLISAFPHLRDAILDQVVFGSQVSAEALRQSSAFPVAMQSIVGVVDGVKTGTLKSTEAFVNAAQNNTALQAEIQARGDDLATLGRFTNSAYIKTIEDSFLPMRDLMAKSMNKTVVDVTADLTRITAQQDAATTAMMEQVDANRKLAMSLSNLTTGLLNNTDGLISKTAQFTEFISNQLNKFAAASGIQVNPLGAREMPANVSAATGFSGGDQTDDGSDADTASISGGQGSGATSTTATTTTQPMTNATNVGTTVNVVDQNLANAINTMIKENSRNTTRLIDAINN